jgi:non-ribosomal peptide synthase protein (TIGR01720 family)
VKRLSSGDLEYLGRIDQQVKIRGYRIEPGEIETILLHHPQIAQAAVMDREDEAGDRSLCAYLVIKGAGCGVQGAVTLPPETCPPPPSEEALRSYLSGKLPDYMIPSRFYRIETMPLTANGKIDKNALLSVEGEGLGQETGFVIPQTENEMLLAGIWESVLGRKDIGVRDNYFALGGDSIKAIQILSRLGQHHLKLEVRHLFETPTIRDLAKKLVTKSRIPEQGMITGRVPLTAIQTWCFRRHGREVDHYAQAVLLRSKEPVDDSALGISLRNLQAHHDALRMTFRFEGESVIQEMAGSEYPADLMVVDLRGREDADGEMDRICAEVPASLELNRGPLMKTVLFRRDDEDRILIVIHHLVVDGVSWRILMEDLGVCYGQAISGQSLALPQKTDSFPLWAEKMVHYSASPKLLEEIPFWRQIEEAEALAIPSDVAIETDRYEDTETAFVALGENETLALMTSANRAYRTEVNDLLLAAFAGAMRNCYGTRKGIIELEGHGREALFDDIDVGRTVGWFTSIYPVQLDIPESDDPGLRIKQIKEGLRRIPNRGVVYGILKYLMPYPEESSLPVTRGARILFNYLGSFDAGEENRFTIDERNPGNTVAGRLTREHEIVMEGAVIGGRLKLSLSYNTKRHGKETVDQFLGAYRDELLGIIDHCVSRKTEELTPHDLTWKGFTLPELDHVLSECGISTAGLKDIYPLSPLQEGMLYHALLDAGADSGPAASAAYFMQIGFGIDGELDPDVFKACWNLLVARHDILRTVFTHRGLDRPLQVVALQGTIKFSFEDISALSDDGQREHLSAFRDRDRKEGVDLTAKTPMRVSVFKRTDRSFEVVWSYHHLLIDGWCAGILMREFFEAYGVFRQGGTPAMEPAAPYGAYIRWLEHRDHRASIDYWRNYLQGYDHPVVLPQKKGADGRYQGAGAETLHPASGTSHPVARTLPPAGFSPVTLVLEIEPRTVEGLKRFASGNKVTLNTVVQTAWALVLGRFGGADDVVFGATVSGRPAEVDDIESMAGLFINTVPVRIRIHPERSVAALVRDVQAEAVKSQPHHYGSLADIQAVTPLKQELLDHVLVFENYPLAEELIGLEQKYPLGFCIGEVKVFEQTHYDLAIVVEPGRTMRVEFRYNAAVFAADLMEAVKASFAAVIGSIAGDGADLPIGELRLSLMSPAEKDERDAFIRSAREISEDF